MKIKNSSKLEFFILLFGGKAYLLVNSCLTSHSEKVTAAMKVPTADTVAITDILSPPEKIDDCSKHCGRNRNIIFGKVLLI